jgi:hypothetical protein
MTRLCSAAVPGNKFGAASTSPRSPTSLRIALLGIAMSAIGRLVQDAVHIPFFADSFFCQLQG